MRRDANDEAWQECKRKVYELDKSQCLLCQVMTVQEAMQFSASNPVNTSTIDPAHRIAVSQRMDLMYDVDNVFCICRCHHNRLDTSRHPITNEHCTSDVTNLFWQRIAKQREENLKGNKKVKIPEFFFEDL